MVRENQQNKLIERRLTALETSMNGVKEELKNLRENHLEKIYQKLDDMERQIYRRPGWFVTGLCSLLVGLIIYILTSL